MKRFYLSAAGLLALAASAQQLPNAGFEGSWGPCVPWTYYGSEGYTDVLSAVEVGVTPDGWVISNVAGMASCYEGEDGALQTMGLGATEVGQQVEGYQSEKAVKLTSNPNPFMASQIVPGYISLGTTWSTANPSFGPSGIAVNNADGGAFGGVPFTGRPTGIEFMFKRSEAADQPGEKGSLVAYLWKGHWTQKDVPAVVYMAGEPTTVDMVDRDRNILGIETAQGGEISKTDDAELIAVINAEISEVGDEWMKFSADFDYLSDATPEYINIIISAGNYFGDAAKVVKDNSITVDNVTLVYGEAADADKYPGTLTIDMAGTSLTPEPVPAEVNIAYDSNSSCTITLPNFTLNLFGSDMVLGDIVVPDVTVGVDGDSNTYAGEVNGLSLMDGVIVADVDVNGTIDKQGNAVFNINVMWEGTPIAVVFNGKGKPGPAGSAVNAVDTDADAQAEYYTLGGVRVLNPAAGIYIKRQGAKVRKVVVK